MKTDHDILKHTAIKNSIKFLEKSFRENPHYSFDDWTIMYEHSLEVMKNTQILAEKHPQVDKVVVAIAGLFHDIGKTVKTDEKTLREKHEELGLQVTEKFLETLELSEEQVKKIRELFAINNNSLEKTIVKDADYMDFYKNKKLNMAFKKWIDANNLPGEIERKIKRFEKLSAHAKEIAKSSFEKMKKEWNQ